MDWLVQTAAVHAAYEHGIVRKAGHRNDETANKNEYDQPVHPV